LAGTATDYQTIAERINLVIDEIETAIIGKRDVITLAMAAVMSNGHILIEDAPGLGKTTLAKSIAKVLGCAFKRIQFTPDLLPADITGTSIFNQKNGEFQFREGPIFAQVILADEINRATPKTQSSLLECMEEYQATIDGITYPMQRPFYVIATDNTLGYNGTYPLPEGQLDRFMMAIYSLQVCGQYDDPRVRTGSDYLAKHSRDGQWFTYGHFYAAPAQYMIGGETWRKWYPQISKILVGDVKRQGDLAWWEPKWNGDRGSVYCTAICTTILAMPYHYLPLYQR
jgi:hypothetical protein